jgi:hypothetical protein
MSLQLIEAAATSEQRDDLHLTRILLLLRSADRRKRSDAGRIRAVEGITKLAKLDFLVRYPTYLERALRALGDDASQIDVEERERFSIETKMVRFRYGPWDGRYRRWLGLLVARGLARVGIDGHTVVIGLTSAGRELADAIADDDVFETIASRADAVIRGCGQMSATRIKEFIYTTFPEIVDLKWGEEIDV